MSAAEVSSPKRDHLMATAWRLFYRDGYRAVGIDMMLYNHFSSKDELIIAVLEKRDCELRASIIAQVEATAGSPADKLLTVFDWLETWFSSADFNGCAFIRALSEYPDTSHPIHQTAWRHKVAMQGVLTQLCTQAGALDPAALGNTLSLLIDGAIVAAQATGSTLPARAARHTAAALLKLAVQKPA
jgi:AcrR family transcriptional regulator